MKRRVLCYAVLVVCFLAAMALEAAQRSEGLSTHHFNLPCAECHISGSDEKIEGQLPETWKLKKDINKSCSLSKCHNFDPILNHPVGIKPKGAIPEDMPLDSQSNMTCLTCHKESVNIYDSDHSDIEPDNKYLLRRPVGEQLCGSCHLNSSTTLNGHWLFSTRAHLRVPDEISFNSNEPGTSPESIDQESRTCLTCHDNITASISFGSASRNRKQMTSHPIGINYMSTTVGKASYKTNVSGNNGKIRLFNGKLGCGTCHSLYAETENYLVAGRKDGTLCRKCHDL